MVAIGPLVYCELILFSCIAELVVGYPNFAGHIVQPMIHSKSLNYRHKVSSFVIQNMEVQP